MCGIQSSDSVATFKIERLKCSYILLVSQHGRKILIWILKQYILKKHTTSWAKMEITLKCIAYEVLLSRLHITLWFGHKISKS